MQETTFERNSGQTGGAVRLAAGSSCSFSFCKFTDNTAAIGSAVAVRPGANVDQMSSCSFHGNWQQSEMRDPVTGRMIDPNRVYNDETMEVFAARCAVVAVYMTEATTRLWSVFKRDSLQLYRMGVMHYENNLVFQMTKSEVTSTLGGTVDVFRSCVQTITNCTFCNNGMSSTTMLPSKGALVIESPSCELTLVQSLFAHNQVQTSGAAMQVCDCILESPRITLSECEHSQAKQASVCRFSRLFQGRCLEWIAAYSPRIVQNRLEALCGLRV